MRAIQESALDLFDDNGFDKVTIEQIAAQAEVSPSSIYRYFGTKEGIIVADEFDDMDEETLERLFGGEDPIGGLLEVVRSYESAARAEGLYPDNGPWRRVRYFFEHPSVRMALGATLDSAAGRVAPILERSKGLSRVQSRILANAIAFGYLAALEEWHRTGGKKSIADYLEEGFAPLRAAPDRSQTGSRHPSPNADE